MIKECITSSQKLFSILYTDSKVPNNKVMFLLKRGNAFSAEKI